MGLAAHATAGGAKGDVTRGYSECGSVSYSYGGSGTRVGLLSAEEGQEGDGRRGYGQGYEDAGEYVYSNAGSSTNLQAMGDSRCSSPHNHQQLQNSTAAWIESGGASYGLEPPSEAFQHSPFHPATCQLRAGSPPPSFVRAEPMAMPSGVRGRLRGLMHSFSAGGSTPMLADGSPFGGDEEPDSPAVAGEARARGGRALLPLSRSGSSFGGKRGRPEGARRVASWSVLPRSLPGSLGGVLGGGSPSMGRLLGDMSSERRLLRKQSSRKQPKCLICLDKLTDEDFASGEAIVLACNCKGEMALRHNACAVKWFSQKRSNICEVCRTPVTNLPPLPEPPPDEEGDEEADYWQGFDEEPPGFADYVFDCIRVTWVTMIICILFLELNVTRSFVVGAVVGVLYTVVARGLYAHRQMRFRRQQQAEGEHEEEEQHGGEQGYYQPLAEDVV